MHSNRLNYAVLKPERKAVGSDLFMPGIHAAIRDVLSEVMQKMSKVVEQTGGDHGRFLPSLLRKRGALERMLLFSHILPVRPMPVSRKLVENFVDHLASRRAALHGRMVCQVLAADK